MRLLKNTSIKHNILLIKKVSILMMSVSENWLWFFFKKTVSLVYMFRHGTLDDFNHPYHADINVFGTTRIFG